MRPSIFLPRHIAVGVCASLCVLLGSSFTAHAQVVIAPPPTAGSSNPVSPEPLVTRPSTTPCKVTLLTNQAFASLNSVAFPYTPPTACPGPWAKVVFSADFTVSAGSQLDRSEAFYLGNATLFRGTTAEPRATLSPSWHVETDVTDYSSLLTTAQTGIASCANLVNSTYTSTIYANAELDFYPVSASFPAAVVPDMVIPMVPDPTTPNQTFTTISPLTMSVTLPKNVTQLYMDLTTQPDEFWWLSTPNAQAAPYINKVDATALREMDVSIDGTPAGVAPNHPYIFTDGIDPYLWEPITGAQALHLKPYRINLTPFAGALSDGNPHTIVINDINTIGAASLNADLFVYTDHGATTTGGSVVSNTLTTNPGTAVSASVNLDSSGNGSAEITESLLRSFTISGYTNTSAGKVTTTVTETVNFSNAQQLTNSAAQNVVVDHLTSTVDSKETTASTSSTTVKTFHTENPVQSFVNTVANADGTHTQLATEEVRDVNNLTGPGSFTSNTTEDVLSTDQAIISSSSAAITSTSGQASTGTYSSNDSNGNLYSSTLTAANNALTGVITSSSSSASTVFLSTSATTVAQGAPVTLTAKIMPASSTNTSTPTGYVTFYSNGNVFSVIGTSTGTATVITTSLAAGTDTITASYTGDTNFDAETSINSVAVTITSVAPTLTIGTLSPATLTVSQGQSGILSLPITGNLSFSGTVTFACSGAPSEATCKVNPGTVALTSSNSAATETATVSVLVTTTAPTSSSAQIHFPGIARTLGGISVAGLVLLCLPRRRSKGWNAMTMAVLLVLGLGTAATLSGCSGKGTPPTTTTTTPSGTPTGTSTITVTATSGTITQSATFTLTVTQ